MEHLMSVIEGFNNSVKHLFKRDEKVETPKSKDRKDFIDEDLKFYSDVDLMQYLMNGGYVINRYYLVTRELSQYKYYTYYIKSNAIYNLHGNRRTLPEYRDVVKFNPEILLDRMKSEFKERVKEYAILIKKCNDQVKMYKETEAHKEYLAKLEEAKITDCAVFCG